MKNKTIFLILTLLFFSITFISCDNNMINSSDVSGKIYSSYNSPAANVKVTIGDAFTRTSSDGSFRINNVNYPYNITVLDSFNKKVSLFKKLSIDKVKLTLEDYGRGPFHADINVRVPDSLVNFYKSGKLIFTDGENINEYTNIYDYPVTSMRINLNDNNPVTGKIIILTFKVNSSNVITSYENFGFMDVTIIPGLIYNYTFDSASVSLNPGEKTVSGTTFYNQISNETGSSFILTFSNKDYMNEKPFNDFPGASGTLFNFLIPTNIPLYYNTFVYKSIYSPLGYSYALYKVFPDIPNTIEQKPSVSLTSPENNASNLSTTTPFSFYDESGSGIFEIIIVDQSRFATYKIVTTSTNFTLDDIDNSGFGSISNHDFFWTVRKNGIFNSVNDYARDIRNESNWYNTVSKSRNFSTQP